MNDFNVFNEFDFLTGKILNSFTNDELIRKSEFSRGKYVEIDKELFDLEFQCLKHQLCEFSKIKVMEIMHYLEFFKITTRFELNQTFPQY